MNTMKGNMCIDTVDNPNHWPYKTVHKQQTTSLLCLFTNNPLSLTSVLKSYSSINDKKYFYEITYIHMPIPVAMTVAIFTHTRNKLSPTYKCV